MRRRLGHASTETTQVYTLLAEKVAHTEIRAARRKREASRVGEPGMARGSLGSQPAIYGKPSQCASAPLQFRDPVMPARLSAAGRGTSSRSGRGPW